MNPSDLFWSVYANLEQEVLTIARYIHCDSHQLTVYSMAIADLIVRCAMEIEAISKKLYQQLGGNMNPLDDNGKSRYLYFDSDCLALIDKNYRLAKKKIIISSPAFFLDDSDRQIMPLREAHKIGQKNGCKWKDAYQSLKHDRYASLQQYGNIKNLLHAMGALYILNLYLRDKTYTLSEGLSSFDTRVDSVLFSVITYSADNFSVEVGKLDDTCIIPLTGGSLEESVYIIKRTDSQFRAIYQGFMADNEISLKRISESPEIQKFIANNPDYHFSYGIQLVYDALGRDAVSQMISTKNFSAQWHLKNREAVLNKNKNIYPSLPEST